MRPLSLLRDLPVILAFALLLLPLWAAGAPASATDYTLESGDVVGVKVFQEPDLDRELRVSQEGELYFPLIGKVDVKGRTLAEVEQVVRDAYDRDFLVNPQVNIVILKYQVRTVNVLGRSNTRRNSASRSSMRSPGPVVSTGWPIVAGFASRAPFRMVGRRTLSSIPMN